MLQEFIIVYYNLLNLKFYIKFIIVLLGMNSFMKIDKTIQIH